jgi:hypothetical protein
MGFFKSIGKAFKSIGKGISSAAKSVGKFLTKNPVLGVVAGSILIPGGGILGGAKGGLAGLFKNEAVKKLVTGAASTALTNAISGKPKEPKEEAQDFINTYAPGMFNRGEDYSVLGEMMKDQYQNPQFTMPEQMNPVQLMPGNSGQPQDPMAPVGPIDPQSPLSPQVGTINAPIKTPLDPRRAEPRARAMAIRGRRRML